MFLIKALTSLNFFKMYKLSKYNYILTNFPEAAILFNGVTKKFFLIKREKLAQYVNLVNSLFLTS